MRTVLQHLPTELVCLSWIYKQPRFYQFLQMNPTKYVHKHKHTALYKKPQNAWRNPLFPQFRKYMEIRQKKDGPTRRSQRYCHIGFTGLLQTLSIGSEGSNFVRGVLSITIFTPYGSFLDEERQASLPVQNDKYNSTSYLLVAEFIYLYLKIFNPSYLLKLGYQAQRFSFFKLI